MNGNKRVHGKGDRDVIERLLGEALSKSGFTVKQPTGEPHFDIFAQKEDKAFVIEVKRFRSDDLLGFDSLAQVLAASTQVSSNLGSYILGVSALKVKPVIIGTFGVSEPVKETAKEAGITLLPLNDMTEQSIRAAFNSF
ncbi:MAG: hypothetical protein HYX83_00085 [Chloroflexi bacterium]|nr:hypothetical protein [Chloroflexota bacterium]